MAIVETTFTTAANQVWASSAWSLANDPAGKLHTELSTWINALSGTDKFTIEVFPGSAGVVRGNFAANSVGWVLKSTVGGGANNDYGFLYHFRYSELISGASISGMNGSYFNRTAGSSNNGAGTFTNIGSNVSNESNGSAGTAYIQYEASGTTPWFCYSWASDPTSTTRILHAICKLDTSNLASGSYYPTTGLGKWLYIYSSSAGSTYYFATPTLNTVSPLKGITSASSENQSFSFQEPFANGYFFGMPPFYGDAHYLGTITPDWLRSVISTGNFGDTATINGNPYRCLKEIWVRNA